LGRYTLSWLGCKFSFTFDFAFASYVKTQKWKKIKSLVVVESTNVLQEKKNKNSSLGMPMHP
jgi:hypothetical protein